MRLIFLIAIGLMSFFQPASADFQPPRYESITASGWAYCASEVGPATCLEQASENAVLNLYGRCRGHLVSVPAVIDGFCQIHAETWICEARAEGVCQSFP